MVQSFERLQISINNSLISQQVHEGVLVYVEMAELLIFLIIRIMLTNCLQVMG